MEEARVNHRCYPENVGISHTPGYSTPTLQAAWCLLLLIKLPATNIDQKCNPDLLLGGYLVMADPTTIMLAGKDVTRVTGPTIVGTVLNWYLYGILTVQYVLYLLYARNDRTTIKVIVHLIFALDTLQTIFTMDDTFFYFVYGFGDVNRLFQFHWAFDVPTLDAIIGLIVQGVYCWRIWKLSGWRVVPIFLCFVSLLAGASGFTVGVQFKRKHEASSGILAELPSILWLIGSAVADITIAISMTWILLCRKGSSRAQPTTRDRIVRLLALTLETNAITAAVAIATAIIFFIKSIAPPTTNFYQLGGFLLGKLYSNCFMVLLNQRHHGSESRYGTMVSGSYQHGLRLETSGINIELSSRTGVRTGTLDFHQSPPPVPVRLPLPPKAEDLVHGINVPSSNGKYSESKFGYEGSQGFWE